MSHKHLHTHYTDHSVDTVPTAKELSGEEGEVAVRKAATIAGEKRFKRINTIGDPTKRL